MSEEKILSKTLRVDAAQQKLLNRLCIEYNHATETKFIWSAVTAYEPNLHKIKNLEKLLTKEKEENLMLRDKIIKFNNALKAFSVK